MQDNPYAPPAAVVEDIPQSVTAGEPPWFPVSLAKLLVMSVFTLGLYEVYWFYQNWQRVKRRESSSIWPLPRALFAIFFCYQLFSRIRESERGLDVDKPLAAGPLAAGLIIVSLMWRLPEPYSYLSLAAVVFLLPVQLKVNAINAAVAPHASTNSQLSGRNCVAIGLGGLILVMAIIDSISGK